MNILSQAISARKEETLTGKRAESLKRTGVIAFGLFIVVFLSTFLNQIGFDYPKVLIEKPALALPLFAQSGVASIVAPIGLLGSAILIFLVSRCLPTSIAARGWKNASVIGAAIAVLWVISALMWVIFFPLWSQNGAAGNSGTIQNYRVTAPLMLVVCAIFAPVLLAIWTAFIAQAMFRSHRAIGILGILGAVGLVVGSLRTGIWLINAGLSVETGHFALSGFLAILTWALEPIWLAWLFILSVWLLRGWIGYRADSEPVKTPQPDLLGVLRRNLRRFGAVLAIIVFVVVRAVMMLNGPALIGSEVPAEPSLQASLFYYGLLMPMKYLSPLTIDKNQNANKRDPVQEPIGVVIETANISGVPAKTYCAPDADKNRFILYIHGGGFIAGVSNDYRQFAGMLSQLTSVCVLLPDYRLAPAFPFPAALDDSVSAYQWLLQQGISASHIVIAGDSAGGNLSLAVAVSLRDHGEPLPAALYLDSPAIDLAASGDTMVSKSLVDPLIPVDFAKNAFALYSGGDVTKVHDPLASPLYADMHGLPPTFIQVGSEEILLSDSTRVAARMRAAGVVVKLEVWPGMWHTFPLIGTHLAFPEITLAMQHMTDAVRLYLK